MTWEDKHIGSRIIYTGRNGNSRSGMVNDIIQVGKEQWLNLKLDGSSRERFQVPSDTVKLVPDELTDAI